MYMSFDYSMHNFYFESRLQKLWIKKIKQNLLLLESNKSNSIKAGPFVWFRTFLILSFLSIKIHRNLMLYSKFKQYPPNSYRISSLEYYFPSLKRNYQNLKPLRKSNNFF